MPKKTATQTRGQPKVRANQNSGLIVEAAEPRQSARAKSALDNRSHRTSEGMCRHSTRSSIDHIVYADQAARQRRAAETVLLGAVLPLVAIHVRS